MREEEWGLENQSLLTPVEQVALHYSDLYRQLRHSCHQKEQYSCIPTYPHLFHPTPPLPDQVPIPRQLSCLMSSVLAERGKISPKPIPPLLDKKHNHHIGLKPKLVVASQWIDKIQASRHLQAVQSLIYRPLLNRRLDYILDCIHYNSLLLFSTWPPYIEVEKFILFSTHFYVVITDTGNAANSTYIRCWDIGCDVRRNNSWVCGPVCSPTP